LYFGRDRGRGVLWYFYYYEPESTTLLAYQEGVSYKINTLLCWDGGEMMIEGEEREDRDYTTGYYQQT